MARVSVLLPVRDAVATLPACLASLAAQTEADHEVIAVDDGSGDGSAEILRAAAAGDRRLRVVTTPPRGLVSALNHALSLAAAPLLARMDADDLAAPERLAVQAARLAADPGVHLLGSRVRLFGHPGHGNDGMRAYVAWVNGLVEPEAIARDLWVESPLVHPTLMMRAADLRALGGYRDFDGPEDYDLWLRAHAAGWRLAKVPEVLLSWRDSARRLTRTDARYRAERFQAVKLEGLARGPLAAGRPAVIWGAGPIGKSWALALQARGLAVAAFVEVDPRKIGRRIHGLPVVEVEAARDVVGALHLAAVGQPGARDRIRAEAGRLGLEDGRDLLAVA